MIKHLVIPDSHVHKGQDLTRFINLSTEIWYNKPETIIIIGDFFDFESISSFDRPGSLAKEGQRIIDDIETGLAAYELLMHQILEGIDRYRVAKKKAYRPRVVFCEGNHEQRLKRLAIDNAVFEGVFNLEESLNIIYPCEYVPYGENIEIDEILYTHIPHKGGSPVQSVVNTCGAVLDLVDKSCVFGHSHRLEFKQRLRVGQNKLISALNCGCFFEGVMDYAKASNPPWWKGVVLLDVYDGAFDIQTVRMENLL